MAGKVSVKHIEIAKARTNVMAIIAAATVIVVFCLMSTKALLSEAAYQRKVINARHAGLQRLQSNVTAAQQLVNQYNQVFEGTNPTNIIGGLNTTDPNATPPSGDNARIVSDALPSKYDFPSLLSSVNYIMAKDSIQNASISGTDNTASAVNTPTLSPQPITIPLTVSGQASYAAVQTLIGDFERSIRPFDITNIQLNGGESSMTFSLQLNTYYQQPKSLDLSTKEIK